MLGFFLYSYHKYFIKFPENWEADIVAAFINYVIFYNHMLYSAASNYGMHSIVVSRVQMVYYITVIIASRIFECQILV